VRIASEQLCAMIGAGESNVEDFDSGSNFGHLDRCVLYALEQR